MFKPGDFPALSSSSLPVTEIAPPILSRPNAMRRARVVAPFAQPLAVVVRLPPPRHAEPEGDAAEGLHEPRATARRS